MYGYLILAGTPKPPESFGNFLSAASVLRHKHGRMHLRIGKPISVRARSEGRVQRWKQALSPGSKPYDDATKEVITDLAYDVIASHQANFIIMMPAVLSALALCFAQVRTQPTPPPLPSGPRPLSSPSPPPLLPLSFYQGRQKVT